MKKYDNIDILFKDFKAKINKKMTYEEGIAKLFELRCQLMDLESDSVERQIWDSEIDFSSMPLKTDKTIAYYLYHLARIEDITSNILINNSEQVFFRDNYYISMNSPIMTTGNELTGVSIIQFSKQLNLLELWKYRKAVYKNTNTILSKLTFDQARTKVMEDDLEKIRAQGSISDSSEAIWLLEYWGSKDYIGLMLMPFSRHQMLHLGGCMRIFAKLKKAK